MKTIISQADRGDLQVAPCGRNGGGSPEEPAQEVFFAGSRRDQKTVVRRMQTSMIDV